MKLHLGCGQKYLEGYVNIDYPSTEHTVQKTSVADEFHNLMELTYPAGTVAEVRLHHVFEHFSRANAMAFLSGWNSWLKNKGVIHIEVPDFEKTAKAALGSFASEKQFYVGLRHIFGSQEAHWAVHYEGYTKASLRRLAEHFGYKVLETKQEKYLDTYNLIVIAEKIKDLSKGEAVKAAEQFLRKYLLVEVESELSMLGTWMQDFNAQLDKVYAGSD